MKNSNLLKKIKNNDRKEEHTYHMYQFFIVKEILSESPEENNSHYKQEQPQTNINKLMSFQLADMFTTKNICFYDNLTSKYWLQLMSIQHI